MTALYVMGVVLGLAVMRDPWPARVGTALLWPLGPVAFVIVVTVLMIASVLLWPLLMLPLVAAVAAVGWYLLS